MKPEHVCERCGGTATVTVVTVPPNRGAYRPPASEHNYCPECARAAGVSRPPRSERPRVLSEPDPPSWAQVELHLAEYERMMRDHPSSRDVVRALAERLRSYSRQIPGPMPPELSAAFARIDAGR